jgi:hypothetical protein
MSCGSEKDVARAAISIVVIRRTSSATCLKFLLQI